MKHKTVQGFHKTVCVFVIPWTYAPLVIKEIFNIIRRINESGTTVLLVEQNANMALKVAHHAYVLETGRIKMEGSGRELLENEEIKEAYLGKKKK